MKLVIAGSRSIKDPNVYSIIDQYYKISPFDMVVCGGAKGVDKSALEWAQQNNVPYNVYLPNYSMYGKIAPLVRNKKMASYGNSLLAIWDGKSRGTMHMVKCMLDRNKEVVLCQVTK